MCWYQFPWLCSDCSNPTGISNNNNNKGDIMSLFGEKTPTERWVVTPTLDTVTPWMEHPTLKFILSCPDPKKGLNNSIKSLILEKMSKIKPKHHQHHQTLSSSATCRHFLNPSRDGDATTPIPKLHSPSHKNICRDICPKPPLGASQGSLSVL